MKPCKQTSQSYEYTQEPYTFRKESVTHSRGAHPKNSLVSTQRDFSKRPTRKRDLLTHKTKQKHKRRINIKETYIHTKESDTHPTAANLADKST